jgi:hypothetical protein
MTSDLPQDLPDRSPQPSPDAAPPVGDAVRAVLERGLEPRAEARKQVVVIGAGVAGLVAAHELKRAGHDVVVLEAQKVRLGAEVVAIDQDADAVTVHFKTEAGRFSEGGDYAVCTLPFSVLRSLEMVTPFSHGKQRAIRQLNYHASTKILFQVRERVWETEDGIQGGATVTDLPIRRMNYPTPDPSTERGMLLASYTWGQDALQWGAMDEETRLEEALDDVSRIPPAHPRGVRGRRVVRLVWRPMGARRLCHVRPRAADAAPGGHRPPGGPDPVRRRALLALPRLDPGRAGVRDSRRQPDPRGPDPLVRDRAAIISATFGPIVGCGARWAIHPANRTPISASTCPIGSLRDRGCAWRPPA